MSDPDDAGDKSFEPTQKKLDDARKKGEIPRSTDLTTAASYGGFLVVGVSIGAALLLGLATKLSFILANSDSLSSNFFGGGAHAILGGLLFEIAVSVASWFGIPALAVCLAIVMQKSFVVTPSKLTPKLSRISPLSNAKNKFGRQGLFEFFKSFTKLAIVSAILGMFLISRTPDIVTSINYEPQQVTSLMLRMAFDFASVVLVVVTAIGVLDFAWQHAEHLRKNRMSRKEMVDEAKQMEGDPHVKQQRRQKGQEIALNQMLVEVPKADVIIVNPEHYAVALQWSRLPGAAPVCVAKGVDAVAAKIREIAQETGIPIQRDPPIARALYATIEIGEQIWPEHYQAVAAAIRFADAMAKKAGAKSWTK